MNRGMNTAKNSAKKSVMNAVDAWQAVLESEHAALYGYGILGGRVRTGHAWRASRHHCALKGS